MHIILFLILSCGITSAASDKLITFVSNVNGVRYVSTCTSSEVVASSEFEIAKLDEHSTQILDKEPTGRITLKDAIHKADKIATEILGTEYTGDNPSWIMTRATKEMAGKDLFEGMLYRVSYSHRRGTALEKKASGSLQIIVLLNGKVLQVVPLARGNKKLESDNQAGTGQPSTRPDSKSEGGDKPQPDAEGRSR